MTDLLAVRRFVFALSLFLMLVLMAAAPQLALAQGTDLSQQMQLFNSLSPDQQQAILQRLGTGSGGSASGLGSLFGGGSNSLLGGSYNSSQSALLQQQMLQQQRRQMLQGSAQSETDQYGNLLFRAGDTVLIDVAMPGQLLAAAVSGTNAQKGANATSATPVPNGGNTALLAQLAAQNNSRTQEGPQLSVEQLEAGERQRLQDTVDLIRLHNPYQLDANGALLLSGFPAIPIAGLTEELASRRVNAEPALAKLQIRLTKLPLQKSGTDALKPFGYDLFDNSALSLIPTFDTPVPVDYTVGAGDILQVQLYGNQNQTLSLIVARDGHVSFPQLGPIEVGGQPYAQVKSEIESRVARQMIGVRANVTMGQTRAINVFVLGGAKYPGSYTVSGLATVTTALFAAGGVEPIGSLRNIQVKRQGTTVRTFDLYDLLMRGDSSNDIKLQPGDVVFIPPVGSIASLDGEVQRPALYELKSNQTVADLLQMGGGLTPAADHGAASLVRIDEQQRRVVLDVNPTAEATAMLALRNGDALHVARVLPQLDSGVTLTGYVYRPQYFAWRQGLKLSQIIPSVDELKPDADLHYLLIRRELPPNRRIAVLSADLGAALRAPGSAADLELMPRDTITVFDLNSTRDNVIQPLMDQLRLQSSLAQPTEIVHIDGHVKVPGDYPLEAGMRISDLIRAGGSLDPSAYAARAELSRYTIDNGEQRQTQVLSIDLNAVRAGDQSADIALQPFDRLSIKEVTGWTELAQVTLRGEVRFPGLYTIKPGETLQSVMQRAGGLTSFAMARGAVFTRRELRDQEQAQIDRLTQRLKTSLAETALMGARAGVAASGEALTIGQTLLGQLQSTKAVGRLVISLDRSMRAKPGSSEDIILRDGDELVVPKQRQEVMVLGEVQDATSHLFKRGMSRDDYIDQSGGLTRQADRKAIYVVRADGSVEAGSRGWFGAGNSVEVQPGDAIVVPLDTERLPSLSLWQAVTTILYNVAIAAAAVHSL